MVEVPTSPEHVGFVFFCGSPKDLALTVVLKVSFRVYLGSFSRPDNQRIWGFAPCSRAPRGAREADLPDIGLDLAYQPACPRLRIPRQAFFDRALCGRASAASCGEPAMCLLERVRPMIWKRDSRGLSDF